MQAVYPAAPSFQMFKRHNAGYLRDIASGCAWLPGRATTRAR
ncbi:hypothetical protein B0G74_4104 [Paraburkholderia sp. BL9I2N2]|jgi:hypothetical protein|nr:hypothetical protein B0G74_4104 [Paraburkholderia sp. BL9I2N2]